MSLVNFLIVINVHSYYCYYVETFFLDQFCIFHKISKFFTVIEYLLNIIYSIRFCLLPFNIVNRFCFFKQILILLRTFWSFDLCFYSEDPVVRDHSAEALGTAWKVVSEKNIIPFLTSVDSIKLAKVFKIILYLLWPSIQHMCCFFFFFRLKKQQKRLLLFPNH